MITSNVEPENQNELDSFPGLYVSEKTGKVILMTDPGQGCILGMDTSNPNHKEFPCSIGEYSTTWQMDAFKPFHGTVTLTSNV